MWSRLLPNLDPQFWRKSIRLAFFALILVPALLLAETAPDVAARHRGNILFNGGFEQGFYSTPVGAIGNGWGWFTNGGAANYGFYDDQWSAVVAEGSHSQLIEINTYGISGPSPDRFAGIYQTVPVVSGATYTLRMEELIRSTRQRGDRWRYLVQVGWTEGETTDWTQVTNWTGVRSTYYPRTEPGRFRRSNTRITPQSSTVTIYIRVWKKWGNPEVELDVNLDAISLTGPIPHQ